ncbi:pre-rRNA processing and 40S ribosomal subunit assembly [Savitreella phatthalungensis]
MDPRAVAELQRLYAARQSPDEDAEVSAPRRETKRRRLSAATEDAHDTGNVTDDEFDEALADASSQADSDASDDDAVEVVSFNDAAYSQPALMGSSKAGYRAMISGKLPTIGIDKAVSTKSKDDGGESGDDEIENLKNDRELQRLLRESHLLQEQHALEGGSGGAGTPTSLELRGKQRHKAQLAQLLDLPGAAKTLSKQTRVNMPQKMRLNMARAQQERKDRADKHARDNGIINARDKTKSREAQDQAKRVKTRNVKRGTLGELSIGKYKAGKLTLSQRDIDRVSGSGTSAKGKGKRGTRGSAGIKMRI